MQVISSKKELLNLIQGSIVVLNNQGIKQVSMELNRSILQKKVRFPLLEQGAIALYQTVPENQQIELTDSIIQLQTIGGNVLAGIILQNRLAAHFSESINKATEYIIAGDEWYVCDIIGERVLGHALLIYPEQTLEILKQLSIHDNKWMVRSVGVAIHYAVKRGLIKKHVKDAFAILLRLATTTDFHTKKGIGWAAKTIAKFHPDIIEMYQAQIADADTKQWFKTKINIGLNRTSKYAHRHTS